LEKGQNLKLFKVVNVIVISPTATAKAKCLLRLRLPSVGIMTPGAFQINISSKKPTPLQTVKCLQKKKCNVDGLSEEQFRRNHSNIVAYTRTRTL
jgi:invasion protein IalB